MEIQILFSFLGVDITSTVVATWLAMVFILLVAFYLTRGLQEDVPGGRQNIAEFIVESLTSFVEGMLGPTGQVYLPFIATIAIFVLVGNLMAMVPWIAPPTADLSTTAALAIIVFITAHFTGIKKQGLRRYLREFVQPYFWLLPLNLVGEISKILSHAFRLYGNMVGGGIIISIIYMFAPWGAPVLFMGWFIVFMGVIQAAVFTLLATVYIELFI